MIKTADITLFQKFPSVCVAYLIIYICCFWLPGQHYTKLVKQPFDQFGTFCLRVQKTIKRKRNHPYQNYLQDLNARCCLNRLSRQELARGSFRIIGCLLCPKQRICIRQNGYILNVCASFCKSVIDFCCLFSSDSLQILIIDSSFYYLV